MAGKNHHNDFGGGMEGVDALNFASDPVVPAAPKPLNPENVRKPRIAKPADKRGWWWGTGRRKTAVARVRLKPAEGESAKIQLIGNDPKKLRSLEDYFSEDRDRADAVAPLRVTGLLGRVQVIAKCHGGGLMGQAQAVRLGIARALRDYDPNLEQALRDNRLLTRDSREVERKKYGQAGARRRFQFSKR
jgi:small subunit ribosomal protein S9